MNAPICRIRAGALALLVLGMFAFALPALSEPSDAAQEEPERSVLTAEVSGPIPSVVADYLVEGLHRAEREGHQGYLVELNTWDGVDASMREIVRAFLDAKVPVIVYVTPPGGRATSAGALITYSADVAAMTMGTAIGAATPVGSWGREAGGKVVDDAAAFARSIATEQGRSPDFAEASVREGKTVSAQEAAAMDVVDLLAPDRQALLQAIDGRTVEVADGSEVTLRTSGGVATIEHEMRLFTKFRYLIAEPNLAFLFLCVGSFAMIYGQSRRRAGVVGAIGVVLLALGIVSLSVLPTKLVGLLLLAFALALFVAVLFTSGVGLFAVAGSIGLVFAGLLLFDGPFTVNPVVLFPMAAVMGFGTALAGRRALRRRAVAAR